MPALAECGTFGTPLDAARRNGHAGCVAILQKYASVAAENGQDAAPGGEELIDLTRDDSRDDSATL